MKEIEILSSKNKIQQSEEFLSSKIMEQYKKISKSYDNAQQKMLELEQNLKNKTDLLEEKNVKIEKLKNSLEENINEEFLVKFIEKIGNNKELSLDLLIEIQNIQEILLRNNQNELKSLFTDSQFEISNENANLKKEIGLLFSFINEELK